MMLLALACASPPGFLPDPAPPPPPTFADIATAASRDAYAQNRGTAAEDFDGDGDVDVFLANPKDPSLLLLNDGRGQFTRQEGTPTTGTDEGVSAADYDNDGDADLYLACGGWWGPCADGLYRNDGVDPDTGQVIFTDVSAASGVQAVVRSSFGTAWADFDGDGWLDLLVSTKRVYNDPYAPQPMILWHNQGDGTFLDVAQQVGIDAAGDEHQPVWFDLDGDRDLDVAVPEFVGRNHLYRNDGGTFTDVTPADFEAPVFAFGAAAADIDGDGIEDLLMSAHANAHWIGDGAPSDPLDEPALVWLADGVGGLRLVEPRSLVPPDTGVAVSTMGFAVGDLDLDGRAEIFLGNGHPDHGERNELVSPRVGADGELSFAWWTEAIDGAATPDVGEEAFNPHPYRTHGTVLVDLDGDGDLDIFEGNGGMSALPAHDEPNRVWRNDQVGGRSFVLDLTGTRSNRDAVGATVSLVDPDGVVRTSVVRRNNGFNNSLPRVQVLALGGLREPIEVQVQWPSGQASSVAGVVHGARVTLVEP